MSPISTGIAISNYHIGIYLWGLIKVIQTPKQKWRSSGSTGCANYIKFLHQKIFMDSPLHGAQDPNAYNQYLKRTYNKVKLGMSKLPSLRLFWGCWEVVRSSSSTFPRTLWTTFFHRFEIDFGEDFEFSELSLIFPVLEATEAAGLTSIGEECLLEDTEDTLLLKFSDAECRLLSQANAVDELRSTPVEPEPDLWGGFEVMAAADLKTASTVEDQDFMCFVTRCAHL